MLRRNRGMFLILLSVFFFALEGLFIQLAGDVPPMHKIFYSYVVPFFVCLGALMRAGENLRPPKGAPGLLMLRVIFGILGTVCYIYALAHLVMADAVMLNKMSPFFAILLSFLFLRERIRMVPALAVVAAFLGSMLVIRPSGANLNLGASLTGLLSGVACGVVYTVVRKLGVLKVPSSVTVFYFAAGSLLLSLPFLLLQPYSVSGIQLLWMLLTGVVVSVGQFAMTQAYRYQPAGEISIFDYFQIVFSAILGFLVFRQRPDWMSLAGYLVVIGAAAGMFVYNNRMNKAAGIGAAGSEGRLEDHGGEAD